MKEEIIHALKDELEFADHQEDSQWILAVAIKEGSQDNNTDVQTVTARIVVKTSTSSYVDGTDIKINLKGGTAELDPTALEDAPIFHGGTVENSLEWIQEIGKPFYIQMDNPFITEK